MGRAHMEHIRHIPGLFAVKINPFQHQPFLLGQTGQRLMQLLGQYIGLGLFSHRCGCIHQLGLQKIRISAGGIHASQIGSSLLPQEVQHTPPYAMHGIKTESYAPLGLIAFHCLYEAYGSLLDHIHDILQLAEGQRLFEYQGLISLDEPVPVGSRVIRLARCRLDHDAIDLYWHSPELLELTLTARQLPEPRGNDRIVYEPA